MRAISIVALAALAVRAALAAPTVSSFFPAKSSTGAHPRTDVVMTFSEEVEAIPAMLIELRRQETDHVISAVAAVSSYVTASSTSVTVKFPVVDVPAGNIYVHVELGAFVSKSDKSAFAGVTDKSWTFSIDGERLELCFSRPACTVAARARARAGQCVGSTTVMADPSPPSEARVPRRRRVPAKSPTPSAWWLPLGQAFHRAASFHCIGHASRVTC